MMDELILVTDKGCEATIRHAVGECRTLVATSPADLLNQCSDGSIELKQEAVASKWVFAFEQGYDRLIDQLAGVLGETHCCLAELEQSPWNYPPDELAERIRSAKPIWADQVFTFGDLPPEPPQEAFKTGFQLLDEHGFRLVRSAFMPVIGPYGSGKSVLLRQLAVQMWKLHGWRSLFTTFEEKPSRFDRDFRHHLARWTGPHTDPNGDKISKEVAAAFRGLRRKRYDLLDVDRLVDLIGNACHYYGVDMVVIDPVNEVDHIVGKTENKTDYMGRFIMKLKHLADDHNLLMVCAAHPPKETGSKRSSKHVYTLSDGADTAHYGNKADIGWCVWRPDLTDRRTYLNIDKCKDVDVMGQPVHCKLRLDPRIGAFDVVDKGPHVMAEMLGAEIDD